MQSFLGTPEAMQPEINWPFIFDDSLEHPERTTTIPNPSIKCLVIWLPQDQCFTEGNAYEAANGLWAD